MHLFDYTAENHDFNGGNRTELHFPVKILFEALKQPTIPTCTPAQALDKIYLNGAIATSLKDYVCTVIKLQILVTSCSTLKYLHTQR